jgi:2'-5' RNA ligase
VELLLDDETVAAVRGQWRQLQDAGLPSQAGHPDPSNRPHVTLAVSDVPWDPATETSLATAARGCVPVPVLLGALLIFPRRRGAVLARLVVPSSALLALHGRLASAAAGATGAPAGATPPHLGPGAWTPHVTLARTLTADQLSTAVTVIGVCPDISGIGVAVRRWDGDTRHEWQIAP